MNYSYGTDPEKIQASYSRNPPVIDQGDLGNSYYQNDSMNSRLIPLDGCSNSEAAHLLNERTYRLLLCFSIFFPFRMSLLASFSHNKNISLPLFFFNKVISILQG